MSISLKNHEDRLVTLENRNFGISNVFTNVVGVNKSTTKTVTVPTSTKFIVCGFTATDQQTSWTWRNIITSYQYLKTVGTVRLGTLDIRTYQHVCMTYISPDKIKLHGDSDGSENSNVYLKNFYAITYLISYRVSSMFKEVVSWLSL